MAKKTTGEGDQSSTADKAATLGSSSGWHVGEGKKGEYPVYHGEQLVRTYTIAENGEDAEALAKQFVAKQLSKK